MESLRIRRMLRIDVCLQDWRCWPTCKVLIANLHKVSRSLTSIRQGHSDCRLNIDSWSFWPKPHFWDILEIFSLQTGYGSNKLQSAEKDISNMTACLFSISIGFLPHSCSGMHTSGGESDLPFFPFSSLFAAKIDLFYWACFQSNNSERASLRQVICIME